MAAPPLIDPSEDVPLEPPPAASESSGMETILLDTWPWIWPTLLLSAWVVFWLWLPRKGKAWLTDRVNPKAVFGLKDKFVEQATFALTLGLLVLGGYGWIVLTPVPERVRLFVADDLTPWMWPSLILIAFVTVGFFFVRRGLIYFQRRTAQTESQLDDMIVAAVNRPLYIMVVLLGFNLWAGLVPLPEALNAYVSRGTEGTIVILIMLLGDGLIQSWMRARQEKSNVLRTSGAVIRVAVRAAVYVVGGLMALTSLGIDVTPVLASLGVTSIAIGLALQGTLEDFLAGLLLAADQPIAVGDFVQLESGESGVVLSIGWRTTRMQTRDDMHVIVPNSKLAKSLVVNRSRPRAVCKFLGTCGVHYDSDLAAVEEMTIEVARELINNDPRAVAGFEPRLVYTGFNSSSIDFGVWLCAKSWEEHFGLKSHFIKSLKRRFDAEGIVIPFPIRTLDLPQGTRIEVQPADVALDAPAVPATEDGAS